MSLWRMCLSVHEYKNVSKKNIRSRIKNKNCVVFKQLYISQNDNRIRPVVWCRFCGVVLSTCGKSTR